MLILPSLPEVYTESKEDESHHDANTSQTTQPAVHKGGNMDFPIDCKGRVLWG